MKNNCERKTNRIKPGAYPKGGPYRWSVGGGVGSREGMMGVGRSTGWGGGGGGEQ